MTKRLPTNRVVLGDCLDVLPGLPDAGFGLVYLDPPFNTGREQSMARMTNKAIPKDFSQPVNVTLCIVLLLVVNGGELQFWISGGVVC